jgi:phosphatidylglycerophosphate synthase
MSAGQNMFQRTAEATGGMATPANLIDAAAFAVGIRYASRMDTAAGVGAVMGSYVSDLIDGPIARATGTSSELGASVDAAGDKLKTAYVIYNIAKGGLASRSLLTTVAAHNIINAAATVYDRTRHETPRVEVTREGKYGMFADNFGLGLQVIATEVSKTNERHGRQLRTAGAAITYTGLALFGVRASVDYWRTARS